MVGRTHFKGREYNATLALQRRLEFGKSLPIARTGGVEDKSLWVLLAWEWMSQ